MGIKQYYTFVLFIMIYFMTSISAVSAQDNELVSLLDRIAERIDSYLEMKNWRAIVVMRQIFTDKQWNPTDNLLTIKSMIMVIDGEVKKEFLPSEKAEFIPDATFYD